MKSASKLVQDALGLDFAELTKNPEKIEGAVESAWTQENIDTLRLKLRDHYIGVGSPHVNEWELVPYVHETHYPTGVMIGGPNIASRLQVGDVRRTLLYAHKVAAYDPLCSVYYEENDDNVRGSNRLEFFSAVGFWGSLLPLIEAGIVILASPPPPLPRERGPYPLFKQLWEEASASQMFHDELQRISPDFVSPDIDDPNDLSLSDEFTSKYLDVWSGLPGLAKFKAASQWLPSKRHLGLALMLVKHGLNPMTGGRDSSRKMAQLVDLIVPSFDAVALADVIRIRQDSAVFEDWRKAVAESLERISQIADMRNDEQRGELIELRAVMRGVSARTAKEVKLRKKNAAASAMRTVVFGSLGATAAGGALHGLSGAVTGGVGGAIAALFNTTKENYNLRAELQSKAAMRRHALTLCEDVAT